MKRWPSRACSTRAEVAAITTGSSSRGKGRQVVAWPSFDALGQPGELAAVLDRLAELAPTAEEASNLRKAAEAVRTRVPTYAGALLKGALGAAVRGALG